MGRAIDHEKRIDALELKVNEIFLILDEFRKFSTTKENIDIHEATKEKTNNEGSGESGGKSDTGKSKPKRKSSSNSKNSKWLYRV